MRFLNEEKFYGVLDQEKVEALNFVIGEMLKLAAGENAMPRRGTFILDGQKEGEAAEAVYRFNLIEGPSQLDETLKVDSDELARLAIDGILGWPVMKAYPYEAVPELFGKMPSGIYHGSTLQNIVDDEAKEVYATRSFDLSAVVVNTNYGRFVAAFYAEDCKLKEKVLAVTAQMLSAMGSEADFTLKKSCQIVSEMADAETREQLKAVMENFYVSDLSEAKWLKKLQNYSPLERKSRKCYFQ